MAKANKNVRKRSNVKEKVKKEEAKPAVPDIAPINTQEVTFFNQLIEVSNSYAKSRGQYSQYDAALKALKKNREKVNAGEYKVLNVPVAPDTTTQLTDKKKMLKYLDNQITQITTATQGVKGQIDNKRDVFIEVGLRLEAFMKQRFGGFKVKHVASAGYKEEEEKVLFKAEYEKLMKETNPENYKEEQKKFGEALLKAKEVNEKMKKPKSKLKEE